MSPGPAVDSVDLSEKEFERRVRDQASSLGWAWWHFSDSRRQLGKGGRLVGDAGAAGFPDYTLAHSRHGLVFAELKTRTGKLSDPQRRSLDALAGATVTAAPRGVRVHVWRPADWDDVIIPVLTGAYTGDRFYGF